MSDSSDLTRREFTLKSALAMLAGATITVSGCESDSPTQPTDTTTPAPGASNVVGTISANHGHDATISGAELTAGNAVSLDITGSSSHPHTVELTMAEVMSIAGGAQVSKESSTDAGHSHTVTFN